MALSAKIGGLFSKSQFACAIIPSSISLRHFHVTKRTLKSHKIAENLQEFIAERNKCSANRDSLIQLQSRFDQPISPEQKPLEDFIKLLHNIKKKEDIQIPLEILRKNKNVLQSFPENRMVVYFSKLLYALKTFDQLADLLRDKELEKLFKSSPSTHYSILILGLVEEKRHLEACRTFLEFLQTNATDANSVGSVTPLIEVFAKSAFYLNNKESIEITEKVIDILIKYNYQGFTNFVIHNYICMLCINQNRPEVAKKLLVVSTHSLSHNLSSIIHSQLNRVTEAFLHLEYIVNSAEKKKMKRLIFTDTFDQLEKAIKEGRADDKEKFALMNRLVNLKLKAIEMDLLNKRTLDQHIESESIRLSKYTKEYLANGKKRKKNKPASQDKPDDRN